MPCIPSSDPALSPFARVPSQPNPAGTVKPHHALTPEGVALGYSHLGMLAAARWLLGQTKSCLIQALEEHPGYQLRAVGE